MITLIFAVLIVFLILALFGGIYVSNVFWILLVVLLLALVFYYVFGRRVP